MYEINKMRVSMYVCVCGVAVYKDINDLCDHWRIFDSNNMKESTVFFKSARQNGRISDESVVK